ncbi:hypothetical protein AND_000075 [Anopheles darlingi]|uniref:Uncharacterized protein n=1 Tax=Anopheles darlingi TaxID=43151 RepID=W5JUR1_ANODA|nr:hypothetical protein AND_000075 [Anopheles darlingi]
MDKDSDKKGGGEKKGGGGGSGGAGQSGGTGLGGAAGVNDPAALLDAASLFAYWGRDPSAMAAAAASNPLFGSQFAMPGGLGGLMPNAGSSSGGANDRFSMSHQHQNTMAVAASQAASLAGLHNIDALIDGYGFIDDTVLIGLLSLSNPILESVRMMRLYWFWF